MLIWLILCSNFTIASLISMTRPATVLYGSELGMSAFEVGMLVAAYSLTPMLIAIRMGKAADRYGDRIVILLGLSCAATGLALPALFANQASLYAMQLLVGIGQLGAATSLQNLLGNSTSLENRDRNFAWFTTAVAAGSFAGPFCGGLLAEHISYIAVFVAAFVAALIAMAIGFFFPRGIRRQTTEKLPISASLQLLKLPLIRRSLLSGTLIQYSRDIYIAYFPLFGAAVGLSPFTIGVVISLQGISMLLARLVLPVALRHLSREVIMLGSIYLAGIAFLVVPTNVMTIIYLGAIAMGAGLGCAQPLSMSESFAASPKGRSGEVLGVRLTALRLGQFAAPLVFGAIGSTVGLVGVFFVNGAVILGGGYIVQRQRPKAGPPGSGPTEV